MDHELKHSKDKDKAAPPPPIRTRQQPTPSSVGTELLLDHQSHGFGPSMCEASPPGLSCVGGGVRGGWGGGSAPAAAVVTSTI